MMRNERGLSLIATLWIITILAVLAGQFLYSIRLERGIQANLEERIKMQYTARAGLEQFIAQLKADETPYDTLDEAWAERIEGEIPDAMRGEQTLQFQVQATDESAKININEADENMVSQLLMRAGVDQAEAQTLTQAVIQARDEKPFRTVGDIARAEGMTDAILYGTSAVTQEAEQAEEQQTTPLTETVTVFSLDKNTDAEDNARTNITSADANALTQIQDAEGNALFTQGEAEAVIAQREQEQFNSIADLLNAPAVSQQALDNARDRLTTDAEADDDDERVNINSASQDELQQVFGDAGIAEDIIRHRDAEGEFGSVDDLRQVSVMTTEEMATYADKLTTTDETTIPGLVNLNTAPQEILELLPNMDANKAQAIVNYRESASGDSNQSTSGEEQVAAFENIGQLLNVEGIDEQTFRQLVDRVTYRSQVFQVEAAGVALDEKIIARNLSIVDRSGESAQIRYWRRN